MTENEIAEVLGRENEEFRKVFDEHRNLKEKISRINRRVYLTPEEEHEKKTLQKVKLQMKDRMADFIRQYKVAHS
ncbi:MAG: DUF465 domain-containing protein [Nitrospirota bacterium]